MRVATPKVHAAVFSSSLFPFHNYIKCSPVVLVDLLPCSAEAVPFFSLSHLLLLSSGLVFLSFLSFLCPLAASSRDQQWARVQVGVVPLHVCMCACVAWMGSLGDAPGNQESKGTIRSTPYCNICPTIVKITYGVQILRTNARASMTKDTTSEAGRATGLKSIRTPNALSPYPCICILHVYFWVV
jgi:hypothetical protein